MFLRNAMFVPLLMTDPKNRQKPHFFGKKPEKCLENCRAFFHFRSFSRGIPGKRDFWPIFGVEMTRSMDPNFGAILRQFSAYFNKKSLKKWSKNPKNPPKLRSKTLFWGWFTSMLHKVSGQNPFIYKE